MSIQEKIESYIENTARPESKYYNASLTDVQTIGDIAINGDLFASIILAFNYGRAKGYRQAKAEQRRT